MLPGFCPASFGVLFCSVVLAADTHLNLLDRAVSGARFLTGGVFERDIAHRRSVAVLCMLYKIRCNPMHPLIMMRYLDLSASAGYTRCPICTSVYLCGTSLQNLAVPRDFCCPLSVPMERSIADPVFDGVGLAGFKSRANAFLLA